MSQIANESAGVFDVGEQLRTIRQVRRPTLKEVADRAGLSEIFLSQVERGRTSASISSLQRIAVSLGVDVSDVFAYNGAHAPRVVHRDARSAISFGTVGLKALLTPKAFHSVEVVLAEPRLSTIGFVPEGGYGPTTNNCIGIGDFFDDVATASSS